MAIHKSGNFVTRCAFVAYPEFFVNRKQNCDVGLYFSLRLAWWCRFEDKIFLIKILVFYRVKIKVNFTLEQDIKAQRGSRNIALLSLFNLDVRWGRMVKAMTRQSYFRVQYHEYFPVFVVQEAGWVPGPVWKGVKNLVPLPIGTGCILSAGLI